MLHDVFVFIFCDVIIDVYNYQMLGLYLVLVRVF